MPSLVESSIRSVGIMLTTLLVSYTVTAAGGRKVDFVPPHLPSMLASCYAGAMVYFLLVDFVVTPDQSP